MMNGIDLPKVMKCSTVLSDCLHQDDSKTESSLVCFVNMVSSLQTCDYYGAHTACGFGYHCCDNNSDCCPDYFEEWLPVSLVIYKVIVAIGILLFIYLVTKKKRTESNDVVHRQALNGSCHYHAHYV